MEVKDMAQNFISCDGLCIHRCDTLGIECRIISLGDDETPTDQLLHHSQNAVTRSYAQVERSPC
jgi:hypothetical protein